jgi:hypothetical protein
MEQEIAPFDEIGPPEHGGGAQREACRRASQRAEGVDAGPRVNSTLIHRTLYRPLSQAA